MLRQRCGVHSPFEFVPEFPNDALHRPRSGIPKGANGITLDVVRDIEEEIDVCHRPIAGYELVENLFHPAAPFAARSALTARFMAVKVRDAGKDPENVRVFIHNDHSSRPDGCPDGL